MRLNAVRYYWQAFIIQHLFLCVFHGKVLTRLNIGLLRTSFKNHVIEFSHFLLLLSERMLCMRYRLRNEEEQQIFRFRKRERKRETFQLPEDHNNHLRIVIAISLLYHALKWLYSRPNRYDAHGAHTV